jgi:hypothetical protein
MDATLSTLNSLFLPYTTGIAIKNKNYINTCVIIFVNFLTNILALVLDG